MTGINERTLSATGEYGYLIHLLRCGIYGDIPKELPEGMSFHKVYEYAMEHDVANIAFYAVEKLGHRPDPELYDTWKLRRDLALVRDMNQEFARQEIVQAFSDRGILYKELQGTVLKKLYPRPEYRTMSDLDFIVEKSRLEECGEILTELGYCCKQQGDYEIDGLRRPDIFVEIHTDYFSGFSDYVRAMGTLNFPVEQTEQEKLTELYLYNVLHTAKHYYTSGCGIRRVLDMYYLDARYSDRIDRVYIDRALERIDLLPFAQKLSALAESWFGKTRVGDASDAMIHYILDSGLHGKRENFISSNVRRMNDGDQVSFGKKVKYIFTRLFPKRSVMVRKFPVLKKWWILYPIFWIYRIIRMVFGKNREASVLDLKLILKVDKKER